MPIVQQMEVDGKYYALPTAVRSLALFWNKALFKEAGLDPERPPATLDELVDYAKKLTKRSPNGDLLQAGLTIDMGGQDRAAAIGRPVRLGEADFRRFTTAEHFIAVRTMHGGPAPAPLAASFARYRREIADKRTAIDAFAARKRAAQTMLAREVARRIAGG